MKYILWVGGIILAMRIAKRNNRNINTWGAIALILPIISVIILLSLGEKKNKKEFKDNSVLDN